MSTTDLGSSRVAPRRDDLGAVVERHVRSLTRSVGRGVRRVLIWYERARQRRQLGCLSDHMLRDIGLSRADVMAEATKPFWQP